MVADANGTSRAKACWLADWENWEPCSLEEHKKKNTNTHEKWLRNEKHSSAETKKKDFVRMDWRIVLGMFRTKCTRELFGVIMFLLHF